MNFEMHENLQFFFKRYPNDEQRIKPVALTTFQIDLRIEDAQNGIQFFERGTLIDSSEKDFLPPLKREVPKAELLFLNGFGLGGILEDTLKAPLPETEDYMIVEPSIPRFLYALGQTTFNDLFLYPKIHWLIGRSENELESAFTAWLQKPGRAEKAKNHQFRNHPVIENLHAGYFSKMKKIFDQTLTLIQPTPNPTEHQSLHQK